MHTFFVNTSEKELENYSDLLEIRHEMRELVSVDCPTAKWYDETYGYKSCAQKMGEIIDSYKDTSNDFNIIVYVDLLSYNRYTAISVNKHRERYACLKALRCLLKHYINSTLIDELYNNGRPPKEVLIIFEENQPPSDKDEFTEDGKNMIRRYTREFLGLPPSEELDKIIYGERDTDLWETTSSAELCNNPAIKANPQLCEAILNIYSDQLDIFLAELKTYQTTEQPLQRLLDRVIECSENSDRYIYSVSFETNRYAGATNKQERTRRNLRLCLYILECIKDQSVLGASDESGKQGAKEFPLIDWEAVERELCEKKSIYQKKYSEISALSSGFSKLGLAPRLYALDNQKFGMDESGHRSITSKVVNVEEKKDEEKEKKDIDEGVIRPRRKKAIENTVDSPQRLIPDTELKPFDYEGENIKESDLGLRASAKQYIAKAIALRTHHLKYVNSLWMHVTGITSNYATHASEFFPAVLSKRTVNAIEDELDDKGCDYRYTDAAKSEEKKPLKTVQVVSETAYETALMHYLKFCAGRSVAITDIKEQCDRFATKVEQIEDSLNKIKTVAMGLIFAITALYLPFIVIQWEAITQNYLTAAIALVSVSIPNAILYSIFGIASVCQRREYRNAWEKLKKDSDKIIKKNAEAAEKYDQLLSTYIPALRYVYEYKLDVAFYAECCETARAKISHHMNKIKDRITTVNNIIEDLESDSSKHIKTKEEERDDIEINYNISYCSSDKNRKFYSIIDETFLESVSK